MKKQELIDKIINLLIEIEEQKAGKENFLLFKELTLQDEINGIRIEVRVKLREDDIILGIDIGERGVSYLLTEDRKKLKRYVNAYRFNEDFEKILKQDIEEIFKKIENRKRVVGYEAGWEIFDKRRDKMYVRLELGEEIEDEEEENDNRIVEYIYFNVDQLEVENEEDAELFAKEDVDMIREYGYELDEELKKELKNTLKQLYIELIR